MKRTSMVIGLAGVVAAAAIWMTGTVQGQQAAPRGTADGLGSQVLLGLPMPSASPASPAPVAPQVYTMPNVQALTELPAPPAAPAPPVPQARPVPRAPAPAPVAGTGTAMPFVPAAGPTEDNPTSRRESGVSLEWIGPNTARLGHPVVCQLVVKNVATNRVHQVIVRARIPEGLTVTATEPKAVTENNHLVWNLGDMEVRQEKRLDVQLVPQTKGSITLPAFVTLTGCSISKLEVREPKLELKATAPQQAAVGDPATVMLTVSNPGDAPVENIKVHAVLSPGLEHARGKVLDFDVDNLAPHESRNVLVLCVAKSAGPQRCDAVATAEPKLVAQDAAVINLVSPKLEVFAAGPGLRYLDRHAVLLLRVANTGTAVAHNVTLTDVVPAGFKVVAAPNAQHDFVARTVCWYVGDLPPSQSKEVSLELNAINLGVQKNQVVATAARGLRAESEVVTHVEGLSALMMELADADDPVEVGANTSYQIRVTNTGTKSESNLQLVCAVPEQMKFLDARGPAGCACKVQGQQVVFQPLPNLTPRADAIYRVYVHCLRPGDCRFRAQITADGLSNPVLREESTRVYGDDTDGAHVATR